MIELLAIPLPLISFPSIPTFHQILSTGLRYTPECDQAKCQIDPLLSCWYPIQAGGDILVGQPP